MQRNIVLSIESSDFAYRYGFTYHLYKTSTQVKICDKLLQEMKLRYNPYKLQQRYVNREN